jgi:hypothetical protein
LSKTKNVDKLTSKISSSPSVMIPRGAGLCDGTSATDADAPPPAIAKDTPAIPNTGAALLRRFPFEARFACDIAEFLLYFVRTNIPRQHRIRSTCLVLRIGTSKAAAVGAALGRRSSIVGTGHRRG